MFDSKHTTGTWRTYDFSLAWISNILLPNSEGLVSTATEDGVSLFGICQTEDCAWMTSQGLHDIFWFWINIPNFNGPISRPSYYKDLVEYLLVKNTFDLTLMDACIVIKLSNLILSVLGQSLHVCLFTFLLNFLEANWMIEPSLSPHVKAYSYELN